MKSIITIAIYFLLPVSIVFAGSNVDTGASSGAGWIGPIIAVLIVTLAIFIAKWLKKSNIKR